MTPSESINQKLSAVPKTLIVDIAKELGVSTRGSHGDIAKRLLDKTPAIIDGFIKRQYSSIVKERQENCISDEELLAELAKVTSIEWGVIQGQLDAAIQRDYVRKFARYNDLIEGVKRGLHSTVTGYAIASWYNHWSTVLIENHIGLHPNVVPTIKNVKGVDIFLRDHPFDLKLTYLPKNYNIENALTNPTELARWMYENQGEQRFGSENRFYIMLIDQNDPDQSWQLKRSMNILAPKIDAFLDSVTVNESDVLPFVYKGRSYTAKCKTLVITSVS